MLEGIIVIILLFFGVLWLFPIGDNPKLLDLILDLICKPMNKSKNADVKPSAYQNDDYQLGYLKCRTPDKQLTLGFRKVLEQVAKDILSYSIKSIKIECHNNKHYKTEKDTQYHYNEFGHTSSELIIINILITDDQNYKKEIDVIDESRTDIIYRNYTTEKYTYDKFAQDKELDIQIAKYIASKTNEKYRAEGNRVVRSH